MNLAMPALKAALGHAGFTEVRTLLSSGNAVFTAKEQKPEILESKIEKVLTREVGKSFMTFVRPVEALQAMLDADPYSDFRLLPDAKRVVTFTRKRVTRAAKTKLALPIEHDGAQILTIRDSEIYTAYVRSPRGPVFMTLLEKTFGKDITTRTWETVKKAVR
jgi:uncharacterized protein (DUF1697 family)